jgi:nicotinamidase-related amidase
VSPNPLPRVTHRLAAGRAALLLIDLQNYDAHPDHGIGPALRADDPEAAAYYFQVVEQRVVPNVRRLLAFFHAHGLRVAYTQSGATLADGSDLSPHRRARFAGTANGRRSIFHRDEPEYAILEALTPRPGDLLVHKNTISAFNSSNLDLLLRNLGVDDLVIAGVVTDGCVDSTGRDAVDRGYRCVIVSDACAAWDQSWHEQALAAFARYWGRVRTTDEVMAELSGDLAAGLPSQEEMAADGGS